ncbi:MAG: DUF599 domain-containing protein [Pseudomonadota bacterium]
MDFMERLALLNPLDAVAVLSMFASWMIVSWRIEHPGKDKLSVTALMSDYRREWMRTFVTRQPRIFDSQILGGLRQGTAFFASSSIIALGGVLALAGNTAPLQGVATQLAAQEVPALIWQLKLVLVGICLVNSFLKFVWANRLFGYCAVVMSAVPNDPDDPQAYVMAGQAAELNIRAAINFNRGLRSVYYALAAVTWLLGPLALLVATTLTVWTLWSREFNSIPRTILLGTYDPTKR